jgi:GGDEF domain-containing protein
VAEVDDLSVVLLCDPLTGLVAYPSFEAHMIGLLPKLAINGLHLAIGDVDDLRSYVTAANADDPNLFGHLAGNDCMRRVGGATRKWVADTLEGWPFAVCGTFGGDEVIVAAAGRTYDLFLEGLMELALRIRSAAPRTCSFASATTIPVERIVGTAEKAYRRLVSGVDERLFRHKARARTASTLLNGALVNCGNLHLFDPPQRRRRRVASNSPEEMLWCLRETASDRLLRLFACGCCRRIWSSLEAEAGRRAIEASESFAEGKSDWYALSSAEADVWKARVSSSWLALWAAAEAAGPDPWHAARWVPAWAAEAAAEKAARLALGRADSARGEEIAAEAWQQERRSQCAVFRDLFDRPERLFAGRPAWLVTRNQRLVDAAHALCDQGRFNELPSLVPALEAARCDDPEVLAHCTQAGEHFRGCWVLDLILGKRAGPRNEVSGLTWRRQADFPTTITAAKRWQSPRGSARLRAA